MLGYSRVPYAAALDGNYFKSFAECIRCTAFRMFRCWRWEWWRQHSAFLRLRDAIAALVVIRLILQFLVQAVGVIVFRMTRPEFRVPFVCGSIPLPALAAIAGFLFILFNRQDWEKEIRYAVVILLVGLAIYMIRSWRGRNGRFVPKILAGKTFNIGTQRDTGLPNEHGRNHDATEGYRGCILRLLLFAGIASAQANQEE